MTYGHNDKTYAHIKSIIWHDMMTFEHNDLNNAHNKLKVGRDLITFGNKDKRNTNIILRKSYLDITIRGMHITN